MQVLIYFQICWLGQVPNKGNLWGDSLPQPQCTAVQTNERNSLFKPVLKSNGYKKCNLAFFTLLSGPFKQ